MRVSFFVLLVVTFLIVALSKPQSQTHETRIQEGYPEKVINSFKARQQALSSAAKSRQQLGIQSILSISRTWKPGDVITVAFEGGTVSLRQDIAGAVKPWTDAANLTLDFGPSVAAGQFREWTASDSAYVADIRIAFDPDGYWSFVGSDSIDNSVAKPNEASMNFQGFTTGLPKDWQGVVLHEFGRSRSACYSQENSVLSPQDKKAVSDTYPRNSSDVTKILSRQLKANRQLMSLSSLLKSLLDEYKFKAESLQGTK